MGGFDELLSGYADGHGVAVVLAIAFVLGLRHATEPDHLVAVTTLVASTRERRARAAARLGAAWGAGHAATLVAFGAPVVLFHPLVPATVERAAEVLIGLIIVALALRLLRAWRRGAFHAHLHEHGGTAHVHLHAHELSVQHGHAHIARTARQAFAIGTVHGLAGSGGVTVLLLAAIPGRTAAALALVVLAAGAALSMALVSCGLGSLLATARARRRLGVAMPALGALAAAFGVWYAAAPLVA